MVASVVKAVLAAILVGLAVAAIAYMVGIYGDALTALGDQWATINEPAHVEGAPTNDHSHGAGQLVGVALTALLPGLAMSGVITALWVIAGATILFAVFSWAKAILGV